MRSGGYRCHARALRIRVMLVSKKGVVAIVVILLGLVAVGGSVFGLRLETPFGSIQFPRVPEGQLPLLLMVGGIMFFVTVLSLGAWLTR